MRRDTAIVLATLLLAVAVLASTCAEQQPATASVKSTTQRRCIHDELQRSTPLSSIPKVTVVATNDTQQQRAAAQLADDWQPLRIGTFANDVSARGRYCSAAGDVVPMFDDNKATCKDANILSITKRQMLLNTLIPQSVNLHEHHLLVQRANGRIVMPVFTTRYCRDFSVPNEHTTTGLSDYDFVMYFAASVTEEGVVAWALACAQYSDERPSAGVSNIGAEYIDDSLVTVRTVSHEILHALGFSSSFFDKAKMIAQVPSIRGKPGTQMVVKSEHTVRRAREHYNCPTLSWMELEDEGGAGTAGSHWERRNAKDELMAGTVGIGLYSAITLGAMEDLGFYKANYANAEVMMWGRSAGCQLLTDKCMSGGITQWPSMFCADTSIVLCTSDRLSMGTCSIAQYTQAMPSYYQYFDDPTIAGRSIFVDYCPVVDPFSDTSCITKPNAYAGMVVTPNARCLDVATPRPSKSNYGGVCVDVRCNRDTSTYSIRFSETGRFVNCPQGGAVTGTFDGTTTKYQVLCALYAEVCSAATYKDDDSNTGNGAAGRVAAHLVWGGVLGVIATLVM